MKLKKYNYLSLILAIFMGAGPHVATAQGTSALKQDELLGIKANPTRWHGSISYSAYRNQDQFSDSFMSSRMQLSYELVTNTDFYAQTSYARPFSSVQEDVNRYGFGDLDLGFSRTLFSNNYTNGVSFSTTGYIQGTMPTSDASRKSSLQGASEVGAFTNTVWKRLIFATSHSLTYNFYEFETADEFGSSYNSPYMITNTGSVTWRITNQINWSNALAYYYMENFAGTDNSVQAYSSSLSYIVGNGFTVSGFFSWKDRVITNNALFDDDTTITGAGLRYVF